MGRAVQASAPPRHEVVAFTHDRLAVEDAGAVLRAIPAVRPDVVLHLAAMTRVDACEEDPDRAHVVNALGSRNVARAARLAGALLVHVSTDYVFDGEKGSPYHEFDLPNPISAYGRSKLAGEHEVREHAPDHLVVRTGWLFGSGSDFVSRSVRSLSRGEPVGGIVDRVGTPTYVPHLAEALLALAGSGHAGTVHVAGPEATTWHHLFVRVAAAGDLPGEVQEQKAGDLGLPAPRPANSALTSLVLPAIGVGPLPSLDRAIRDLLERSA